MLLLKLRDLLCVSVPVATLDDGEPIYEPRTYIPRPGQFLQATQPATGILCRLEHRPQTGLFLVIGNTASYPIVAQRMPNIPKIDGTSVGGWCRYLIKDSLDNRVFNLYRTKDGFIGSRQECATRKIIIYPPRDRTPTEQTERRLAKLFADFPELRADVCNPKKSINQLMYLRPYDMTKRRWMSVILRARYPGLRTGQELETEVTAALQDWNQGRKSRGCPKGERPDNFSYTLGQYNQFRQQVIEAERVMSIEPPLPMYSNGLEGLD